MTEEENNISIKAYVDTRFKASDRAADARFESMQTAIATLERSHNATMIAMDKAVQKAESAADRRFESVNEFRKTLSDQTTSFMTRNEFLVEHKALVQRFESLDREIRSRLDLGTGMSKGVATLWGIIVAVTVMIGAIATALGVLSQYRR